MMCFLKEKDTQQQQRKATLAMFKNLKNIFRTRAMTCQKSLLRMEPVLLIRKPEVSKHRKHLARDFLCWSQLLQKIQRAMNGPQALTYYIRY